MAIDYKLVPFGSRAVKGGYRAVVDNDGYVKDADDILNETADRFGLKPEMLRMCMEAVLSTMIQRVAEDGIRRRFGNFFTLRLDIKGRFNGKDSKPDGSQRPQFNLQLLSEFKKVARKIRLVNEQTRKRIYLDNIVSEEKPVGGGKIFWGLTISFHGKNLLPIVEGDSVEWSFTDATGEAHSGTCGAPFIPHPMFVMGNRTTVSWAHWPEDMPRSAIGRKVTFTYCSRAGDPATEMQRHSISATVMDYQGLPRT